MTLTWKQIQMRQRKRLWLAPSGLSRVKGFQIQAGSILSPVRDVRPATSVDWLSGAGLHFGFGFLAGTALLVLIIVLAF